MKIKLEVARASIDGPQDRFDVIDVPEDEARRMIEAGQATLVRDGKAKEKAVKRNKQEIAVK